MSMLAIAAGTIAAAALGVHMLSCALAAARCRPRRARATAQEREPVTLLRPVCGLDHEAETTLESSFRLDHPDYEVIFCLADADDPARPLLETLKARHPAVPCRILVGRGPFAHNPKLDNCAKGWEAARHDLVVMADSNIVLPADYLARIAEAGGPGVGLVTAPPVGGDAASFWAEVECAVLNTYQARVQYAVDALGRGFAQGKTLAMRRSTLARAGGYAVLGTEPAEDAAATKAMRRLGLRIRLAAPPCVQPLGRRSWREVWNRQVRWARLRRATFPHLFLPEILSGGLVPLCAALLAADAAGLPAALLAPAWLATWYGAEAVLARLAGWDLRASSLLAWIVRDLALPAVWTAGLTGRSFSWRGAQLDAAPARPQNMAVAARFAVDRDTSHGDRIGFGEGVR